MERNTITTLGQLRIGDRFTFLKKDDVWQVTSTGSQVTYNKFTAEGRRMLKWDEVKSAKTQVRFLRHTTGEVIV